MTKKNIAVLIDWYLPGNKAGGPVKSVYSMLNLLKNEFNFFVITTNCDLGSKTPYKNIKADTWESHNDIPVYYFSKEKLKSKNILDVINGVDPDIIYLNSFWSYNFSLLPLRFKKAGKIKAEIVLAPRGMLGKGALSIKPVKKKLFLSLIKFIGLHSKTIFHATNTEEEKEIKKVLRKADVKIAANINSTSLVEKRTITKEVGELKLFYLSRIAKVKNLHYALEILNKIETKGKITYDIYGSLEDKVYWNQSETIIKKLPKNISVNYKGDLSFEEVQPMIGKYHYLFLPTLNENFGHSIYETLMSACPVIISDTTPWNEVNEESCGFAISLKDKQEFENVIKSLVSFDDDLYKYMCQNSIIFMKEKINTDTDLKAYKALFA
ncbi:MAG TPA: glycosyltransferase [Bacteroidia bacterium]|nr:glycosyltransferase [Bacteroidia bacterium]